MAARSALAAASLSALAFLYACGPRTLVSPAAKPRAPVAADSGVAHDAPDLGRPRRAVLFQTSGFPAIDAPQIADATLTEALRDLPVTVATSPEELTRALVLANADVLVLPYGSAFPVDAWPRIQSFLAAGGGLVVLGGAPFQVPVYRSPAGFTAGLPQPAFAHDLLIGPAEELTLPEPWVARPASGWSEPFSVRGGKNGRSERNETRTFALTLRTATEKHFPAEHGSDGPQEVVVRPLVQLAKGDGPPIATPLVELDHLAGSRAGGRWVLATADVALEARVIRAMVERALEGPCEVRVTPSRASLAREGAALEVTVAVRRPAARGAGPSRVRVVVAEESGREAFTVEGTLTGPAEDRRATLAIRGRFAPGLHRLTVDLPDAAPRPLAARSGFWVRDDALLGRGPRIDVSRDWLRKDGKAFPFVGTTYMASDVHRQFLFEPNPDLWDRDFAEMAARGIRLVRTGLWTAWSRVMTDEGVIDEGVLAAIDAYVLGAAKHGLVVCFDFFAFLPPTFGGVHPYLDPRSLERQKALLATIAKRFRGSPWVHWDLINEPSYAPPAKLWKTRATGDAYERRAWEDWVRKRHGADDGQLRAIWQAPDANLLAPPRDEDFEQAALMVDRRPRKARDFQEFTQDVVTRWADEMRAALRAAAGDRTLVTLGQDEGGIFSRSAQQLMAPSLDYTAVHTWWNNGDLLWDGVLTKVEGKPNVHQETGLMRLEDVQGRPWRSPADAALLLDRKLAYAFMARGAGVVEWAWNINPTMPIDEESTIGLYRPDGSAKPELGVVERYAGFANQVAGFVDDFDPEPVVLVVPHARAFLGMTGAIDGTKLVVRALGERFGIVPEAISDLKLTAERLRGKKLVVVPAADVLDEGAARALLEASRQGTKILVTGAIAGDSYGRRTPSLEALGLLGATRPVTAQEATRWSASGFVAFEGLQPETVRRGVAASPGALGPGPVWHEPLPLELAREREPAVSLLARALEGSGVKTMPGGWGVAARVLTGPRSALVAVVNERAEPARRRVVAFGRAFDVLAPPMAGVLALVDAKTKAVIAQLGGTAPLKAGE